MLYATVATGYRPGGFDPLPTGGFNLESLRSYEIGSKNELFERHLRVNGDVLYYDYSNFQVVTFVPGGPFGAEPEVQAATNMSSRSRTVPRYRPSRCSTTPRVTTSHRR
jgi:outer membrane receptor protein involved in Fe transport